MNPTPTSEAPWYRGPAFQLLVGLVGIYLVGAWVAFQGIEALVSGLGLPEWMPGLTVAMLIAGLPIVLATAFVQEGVAPAKGEADEVVQAPRLLNS